MNREAAERILAEYVKPIYGFALKHCSNFQDAEDLAQEICLKTYRAFLVHDDIDSSAKFVWTIAHNVLVNFYRGKQKAGIGMPIDDLPDTLTAKDDMAAEIFENATIEKLQSEIAYLSKLQREIVVAYYYENRKQEEIAKSMGIPLGTVKWHLFEAKKNLKKGLETVRQTSELKFNPVKFEICGTNGPVGTKGANGNFFRTFLPQNIAYFVRQGAKSVDEIADALGVSPVYVESEANFLAEYGFLLKQGDRYAINILLDEPTAEIIKLHDTMYRQAASIFANELFDQLSESSLLSSDDIICEQTDPSLTPPSGTDRNFVLWSLIPYIAAFSGEKLMENSVSFEEAATIRPDGGQNICYACVLNHEIKPPLYFESMKNWCGPMWNTGKNDSLWQIASEWSARPVDDDSPNAAAKSLNLLEHLTHGEPLTKEEYAFMSEKGYLKTVTDVDGGIRAAMQIVWLRSAEIKHDLIAMGDEIKERHRAEFDALKAPYIKAKLRNTPKHLLAMQKFGLQYIFYADGWFLLHCMKELVKNGKLKLPAESQKKPLTVMLIPND